MKGSIRITLGSILVAAVYALAWYSEISDIYLSVPIAIAMGLIYSGACAYSDHKQDRREYAIARIRGY